MIGILLRFVAVLYGVFGVASLVTCLVFLLYGPQITQLTGEALSFHILFLGVPFLNAVVSFSIAFSFWTLRNWGRYLAFAVNAVYLATFLFGFVSSRLTQADQMTRPAAIFLVLLVLVLGGIMVLCVLKEVRGLMSKGIRGNIEPLSE